MAQKYTEGSSRNNELISVGIETEASDACNFVGREEVTVRLHFYWLRFKVPPPDVDSAGLK
jgi:hypothetical protein